MKLNSFNNSIIDKALDMLIKRVNSASGLSHPNDRDAAIDIFRVLKKNNYKIDPEYVKIFAFRNKCPAEFANNLYEIAKKIQEGKNVKKHSTEFSWNENIIQQLEK